LGSFLQILEDKTLEMTITDVASEPLSSAFVRVKETHPNLGLSKSAFWFRFSVCSSTNPPRNTRWYLKLNRKGITDCTLFIPEGSSNQFRNTIGWHTVGGRKPSFIERQKSLFPLPITFPLPPLTGDQTTFYVRIYNPDGGLYLPLSIASEDALRDSLMEKTLWLGIYFGTMLALLFFNLYLYISLREPIQVYYIFYICSVTVYFSFINGIAFDRFTDGDLYDRLNLFALGLTIFWGTFFARSFLNTREHVRPLDWVLTAVIVAAAGITLSTPFAGTFFLNQSTSLLGMMSPFLIILAGIIRWWKGFRPIVFFLVAWAILCIGGLVYALTYRGVLPYSVPTYYSFQIGSCLEVVILSFALGERIRSLRRERDSIRRIFGKYVSDKVCDEILSGKIPLDGESKDVTVLISDLRNYTPLVESTPPKELVRITNLYFEAMVHCIENHKGVVLRYAGDSIQAVFGAPLPVENHPELAVRAALDMRQQLNAVNERLASEGSPRLSHGIGIHSGKVTAANIGSPDRLSYSLSGLAVNLASRIESLNKQFGTDILVSETTVSQVRTELKVESLGPLQIRGLKEPLEIFKVMAS
jgi:adenylate cyclase